MKYLKVIILVLAFSFIFVYECQAGDSLYYFEDQVLTLLGTLSDNAFDSTTIWSFVNRSCYEVITGIGHMAEGVVKRDTIVLAANTIDYDLNSDCILKGVLSVRPLNGSREGLDFEPLKDWGKMTVGSEVLNFSQAGQILSVDPAPSAVESLLVWYNAYPNNLIADTSESNIPKEYSSAVIYKTLAKCWYRIQDESKGQFYEKLSEYHLGIAIKNIGLPSYDIILQPKVLERNR